MTQDLNTLLTALYVKIDDKIGGSRSMGRPPLLSDSELVCLAVAQALLGHHSEARWLRFARTHLSGMFPYLPQQSGYNKRLRAALPLVKQMIRELATDSDFWFDNHWIVDSTPVPCGMSRPTVQRSNLAGWAGYGYCASHSRFFWGEQSSIPVDQDLLSGCGWDVVVGSFDELAAGEGRPGADQRDQMRGVDRAPAGLGGLDQLERHGQPGSA
ncbi:hypothetical protein J2853_004247 [Streptosporangium lutulentum]|uniref:Transposase IS701-like DDE domain-containing protein n=1 Tax=Streptosporangium lutulentum TaxID=1461250 RepID=A0ABT9QE42_9ACTN|nr:hypothetical protein [Streptosporangium lutulentum]